MEKLTKSKVIAAIKEACDRSIASGHGVTVDLPGWEGYELRCRKAKMYRVQEHPSKMILVRHLATKTTAWDTTASYLSSLAGDIVKRFKDTGWAGPVASTSIPFNHPSVAA